MEITNTTRLRVLSFPQIDKVRVERTFVLASGMFDIRPTYLVSLKQQ